VPTGKAAHPAVTSILSGVNWGSKFQTAVHILLMGEIHVGLRVPTPSPGAWHSSTRKILALDLLAPALSARVVPCWFTGSA